MPIFLRPGQQFKIYNIYRKVSLTDKKGRVTFSPDAIPIGQVKGMIALASQKELDRWKQAEHPISHTIVVRGKSVVRPEDILELQGEKYYVQGKMDSGGLGIFEIIYCDKRSGV